MRRVYARMYSEGSYWDIAFASTGALRESIPVAEKRGLTLGRIPASLLTPTRRAEIKRYQIPRESAKDFQEWLDSIVL